MIEVVCNYCSGYKPITDNIKTCYNHIDIVVVDGMIHALHSNGNKIAAKINYCPMCGRKLD